MRLIYLPELGECISLGQDATTSSGITLPRADSEGNHQATTSQANTVEPYETSHNGQSFKSQAICYLG